MSVEFDVGGRAGTWSRNELVTSWEVPLQLLTASIVALALALVVLHA